MKNSCLISIILNVFILFSNERNYFVSDLKPNGFNLEKHLPENSEVILVNKNNCTLADIDNDNKEEYILIYKNNDLKQSIFMTIFDHDEKIISTGLKAEGSNVDFLQFLDLNDDMQNDILIGTKMTDDFGRVSMFSFKDNKISKEFSHSYSKIDVINYFSANSGSRPALGIWLKNNDETYKVELVRWNGHEFVEAFDLYKKYYKKVEEYYIDRSNSVKDNPFIWYYLADAQIKSGNKKGALVSIAKGVALNKEKPTKQQFEELRKKILAN